SSACSSEIISCRVFQSEPKWIRLRHTGQFLCPQGCHGPRFVDPDVFVELARQIGLEIVALAFGFRAIDNADGAFKRGLGQVGAGSLASQVEEEAGMTGLMKEF